MRRTRGENMTKNYLIEQYAIALSDFRIADSDEDAWSARKSMAKLETLAMQEYGFEFADSLVYLSDKWLEECVNTERVV